MSFRPYVWIRGRAGARSPFCFFHHLFIDRQHSAVGGLELHRADDAAVGLAQRACAEALLLGGFPGDGHECTARDLQIDSESFEVVAMRERSSLRAPRRSSPD